MISWMSRSTQAQTFYNSRALLLSGLRMIGKGPGDVKRELVKVSRTIDLLIFGFPPCLLVDINHAERPSDPALIRSLLTVWPA
jgi:hypothetical protein